MIRADERFCCKEHGQSVIVTGSQAQQNAQAKSRSQSAASSSTQPAVSAKPQYSVEFRVVDDATGTMIRQHSDGNVYVDSRMQPIGLRLKGK